MLDEGSKEAIADTDVGWSQRGSSGPTRKLEKTLNCRAKLKPEIKILISGVLLDAKLRYSLLPLHKSLQNGLSVSKSFVYEASGILTSVFSV